MRFATKKLQICCILALGQALPGCDGSTTRSAPDNTGIRLLADAPSNAGFSMATEVIDFVFPRDHGSHDAFATEWWYFTGNLESATGRHFGFELTFFRYALSTQPVDRDSRWGSNQAWLAHFALTDTNRNTMYIDERYGRGAIGIAQASDDRLDVRLKDWSARSLPGDIAVQLQAASNDAGMQLELRQIAEIALHGDRGLDRKGGGTGNASYYYSIPRFEVSGTVETPEEPMLEVTGTAWLDREWATSSLEAEVEGWDWFGLQLNDGRSLMLYRLRNADGSGTPFSSGTLIRRDGTTEGLQPDDIEYRVLRRWRSPATGVSYPVEWHVEIPRHELSMKVTPRIDAQEMNLGVRYWEGAVTVSAMAGETPVAGVGYLELAGYR